MDDVEMHLAVQRMKKWPKEWRDTILQLPPGEARMFAELAGLLDASPTDEVVPRGRHDDPEREGGRPR